MIMLEYLANHRIGNTPTNTIDLTSVKNRPVQNYEDLHIQAASSVINAKSIRSLADPKRHFIVLFNIANETLGLVSQGMRI